jgi:hypothetical protein
MMQNQKSEIAKIEMNEAEETFIIKLDRELLWTEGREIITKFLRTLNAYKSAGAVEVASAFYGHYSKLDEKMLKVRDYVIKENIPRRAILNNNLIYYTEDVIEPKVYPSTFESIILSFSDRYLASDSLFDDILSVWDQHKSDLRVAM